eukprot:g2597.t1
MASKGTSTTTRIAPPVADRVPHDVLFGAVKGEHRGGDGVFDPPLRRNDPWFWLRDDERKNAKVLDHLKLENAYAEQETKHLKGLREELYKEHLSHLKETDQAAPFIHDQYFYYTRTEEGKSYKIHCRRKRNDSKVRSLLSNDAAAGQEEILLDENEIAEGKSHCDIRSVKISGDHQFLAFAIDDSGDEVYELRCMCLKTKSFVHATKLPKQIVGSVHWGLDNNTLFYLTQDATKRPYRLWRLRLNSPAGASDELLFEEKDDQFWLGAAKSLSGRFLFACTGSTETSEEHFIDLTRSDAKLTIVQPRTFGLRYDTSHDGGDRFIVTTNMDGAINNRLMTASISEPSCDKWTEIIAYDESRKIDDAAVFKDFLVLEGRQGGLTQLWTMHRKSDGSGEFDPETFRRMVFPEELYEVSLHHNKMFDTDFVQFCYSSLTTPSRVIDRNISALRDTKKSPIDVVVKQTPILNFDSDEYECCRMYATASDKTKIPMSLVYRKDAWSRGGDDGSGAASKSCTEKGSASPVPVHLYGYGSYSICIDPCFHRTVLPLLDRGMIFAIAHIRGGGEMGRYWYEEQGKYLNKRNTFSDFIACAEHLVDEGVTKPSLMSCEGRSAGGLLMGNVVNMRPDLFHVAIAGVPFVDLMTTMCDPSIPLTTNEWEEWGNPNHPKYFDYMFSYSPIDNVREQFYPNILITAGLHDPRVAYWEPAKWASKLRATKRNENGNVVVAKFDLDSGHFSASDRYKWIREKSYDQAFILDKLGLAAVRSKREPKADP